MYSWLLRVNTVLTLSVTVLAALCAVASMTDGLHRPSPSVELEVFLCPGGFHFQLWRFGFHCCLRVFGLRRFGAGLWSSCRVPTHRKFVNYEAGN